MSDFVLICFAVVVVDIIVMILVSTMHDTSKKKHYCGRCKFYNCRDHYCKHTLELRNEFEEACGGFEDYRDEA